MKSWKEQLIEKRDESGFTSKEISDKTKIPVKFIRAIEEGDFSSLPAEIFARSQIERLFNFFELDPSDILKDYEKFIAPQEPVKDSFQSDLEESFFLKIKNFLNLKKNQKNFLIILSIIPIFLLLVFFIFKDSSKVTNNEKLITIDRITGDDKKELIQDDDIISESNLVLKEEKISSSADREIIISEADIELIRDIEIIIDGESWVVVFDKNERLLYELMQTGSYQFSGISPLRFKIGYAPSAKLFIDGKKISFSKAIKGATNYAHFLVNEVNKVDSIRD